MLFTLKAQTDLRSVTTAGWVMMECAFFCIVKYVLLPHYQDMTISILFLESRSPKREKKNNTTDFQTSLSAYPVTAMMVTGDEASLTV